METYSNRFKDLYKISCFSKNNILKRTFIKNSLLKICLLLAEKDFT